MCNGHADTCDIPDPIDQNIFHCRCQHNTCGNKCQQCCSGFEQKAWRISKAYQPFVCERKTISFGLFLEFSIDFQLVLACNCFQHSNDCDYDLEVDKNHQSLDIYGRYEGGGVCKNCQHNTEGINCNRCKPKFYKPFNKHWNETDVCQRKYLSTY